MTATQRWMATAAVGATCAALFGGWLGPCLAVVVAVALGFALRRVDPPSVRRARRAASVQLPMAVDLLAAALRAGAPPDVALQTVGDAMPPPIGEVLTRVARALRVGLPVDEAWQPVASLPGGERLVVAAVRSAASGAALSRIFDRIADDLRGERSAAAEASLHRASVLMVLPLGFCFLPAFLLTGVVPVVTAVLGDVLRS